MIVIRFPQERTTKVSRHYPIAAPASVIILPVVRIERLAEGSPRQRRMARKLKRHNDGH